MVVECSERRAAKQQEAKVLTIVCEQNVVGTKTYVKREELKNSQGEQTVPQLLIRSVFVC